MNMFHNVLVTTLTPLSDTNEITCWDNRPFIHKWPESEQGNDNKKDILITKIVKKNKRNRTAYTTDQLRLLEKTFAQSKYIDGEQRKAIANRLRISEKCIKVWFQNRRMKEKKESSASSCDSSSEWPMYEPVTPPPDNPIKQNPVQNDQYICQTEVKVKPMTSINATPESYAEKAKSSYPTYESSYQNFVANFNPYDVASYTGNNYYSSGIYPTEYYHSSNIPEYVYTNLDNNQNAQVNNDIPDVQDWSASAIDLNYFR